MFNEFSDNNTVTYVMKPGESLQKQIQKDYQGQSIKIEKLEDYTDESGYRYVTLRVFAEKLAKIPGRVSEFTSGVTGAIVETAKTVGSGIKTTGKVAANIGMNIPNMLTPIAWILGLGLTGYIVFKTGILNKK